MLGVAALGAQSLRILERRQLGRVGALFRFQEIFLLLRATTVRQLPSDDTFLSAMGS